MSERPHVLPGHTILPEPLLLFGGSQTDTHPLRGLLNHGPYGAELGFPSQVRLAYFAPGELMGKLDRIVSELNSVATPREAINYYVRYAGFREVFRIPLIQAPDNLKCAAQPECLAAAQRKDGAALVDLILQSMGALLLKKSFLRRRARVSTARMEGLLRV